MNALKFNSSRKMPDNKGKRDDFVFNSSEIKTRIKNKKMIKKKSFCQKSDLTRDRQNKAGIKIPARPKTTTAIAIPNRTILKYWFKSHVGQRNSGKELIRNTHGIIFRDTEFANNIERFVINRSVIQEISTPAFNSLRFQGFPNSLIGVINVLKRSCPVLFSPAFCAIWDYHIFPGKGSLNNSVTRAVGTRCSLQDHWQSKLLSCFWYFLEKNNE